MFTPDRDTVLWITDLLEGYPIQTQHAYLAVLDSVAKSLLSAHNTTIASQNNS